jgi:hypothetical protein
LVFGPEEELQLALGDDGQVFIENTENYKENKKQN